MMRKTIYVIALVFALAAFAGCGSSSSDDSSDTGTLNPGDTKTVTFKAPGTIAYTCAIHPFMHGTIVVQ